MQTNTRIKLERIERKNKKIKIMKKIKIYEEITFPFITNIILIIYQLLLK